MMAGVVVIAASVSYTLAQEDDGQPQPPEYVGARQCFACHRDVGPTHFESPHALTLRPAEPDAILADFEQGQEERVIQLPGEDEARPFTVDDIAYVVGVGQYMQQYVVEAGSEDEGDAQLLVLPVVSPVLISATQAFGAAYEQSSGTGWRWFGLLAVFAVLYLVIGIFAFETLLEES